MASKEWMVEIFLLLNFQLNIRTLRPLVVSQELLNIGPQTKRSRSQQNHFKESLKINRFLLNVDTAN